MATVFVFVILTSLISAWAIQGGLAVEFSVTNNAPNTAGGARFDREIGAAYSRQTLETATNFIWRLFQQNNPSERRNTKSVSLSVEVMDGIAYSSNDLIHLSARYIQDYSGDVKTAVTGVLYHEVAHSWQWNGKGQAPVGLVEGIADFVRLKAGYAPSNWGNPGPGDNWDKGYGVTARFLDYCDGLKSGFVAQLNKKMRDGYSDAFFQDLLGKSVDQLWSDYKAQLA